MSVQNGSRLASPYSLKAQAARLGRPYRWARRARALARYASRRPHDPDFAAFSQLPGDGLFLDVGASIGQSALSFRIFNSRSPILSLEPLPSHADDLKFVGRVIRGHRFLIAGAAEQSGRATLYVPTLGAFELPAESSLNREDSVAVLDRLRAEGADPKRLHVSEIEVELRRLDELDVDPDFVKIDVEGAELGVLYGLDETISRSRPALMIERSKRIGEVAELLANEGYEPFVYDGNGGFDSYTDQTTTNVFFLRDGQVPSAG
jgi:FkbM family methyltransferase